MVLANKCATIVMLTKEREGGRVRLLLVYDSSNFHRKGKRGGGGGGGKKKKNYLKKNPFYNVFLVREVVIPPLFI